MKQSSDKKTRTVVYTIAIIFIGIFLLYGIMYKFPLSFKDTVTKIQRDVTVTDYGIADAVDKVYNSVIVVSTYKSDVLYASGSGFIYKIDGKNTYIVTNYHVIGDGDNYKITFTDGEVVDATLIGGDQFSDIALLKIETKDGYKEVEIGKTGELRVGDTTFTIGAPLDNVYSWTVTRGIISGKERLVEVSVTGGTSDYIMNVIQTDAAVNSGNSGGPLCNSNGEVIGVVSAKISSTGVEGMGFAIPIETVIEKTEQLINGKLSEYPYLGISMYSVQDVLSNPNYRGYITEGVTSGVLVLSIEKGSAASKGKLQIGDIIIGINDSKISNVAYLRYELYKNKIGDTIKVKILRKGKEKTLKVKLTSKAPTS